MRAAHGRRLGPRPTRWVAAAAMGLALASCAQGPGGSGGAGSRSNGPVSLNSISTLRSVFNRDNGRPRLVLILSPT
ncbi:MAG TPA: hypothetical protein VGS19_20970 [Streptosporangiaceae bacterium]|nr:hypothetical protein [Streptosporangiaceae bacterium]